MKKAGEFWITSPIKVEFESYGIGPGAKSLRLDVLSAAAIDVEALTSCAHPCNAVKVAIYGIPPGENSEDYELVKKVK